MKALGLLIVLARCFCSCDAQFPRVCTRDDLLASKECCPIPDGFPEPCGGPGRGHCADTPDLNVEDPAWKNINAYKVDDRRHWPTVFFNRTCECEGNFSGYDCSKCKWGYRGENCDTKQEPAERKNIKGLGLKKIKQFRDYFDKAKNTNSDYVYAMEFKDNIRGSEDFGNVSVYDLFVAAHYYASRATMPPSITGICDDGKDCYLDFAHEGVSFPTWHRAFLLEFERAIQEANNDPDWTLPYWDWGAAKDNQCDICTNEYVGRNDENRKLDEDFVFGKWKIICAIATKLPWEKATARNHTKPCNVTRHMGTLRRSPGTQDPNNLGESMSHLPLPTEVDFALRFSEYDTPPYTRKSNCSFRNLLEGYADTETGMTRDTE
ncbi:tyrosinase-like [Branchiostoma lanceolatum]|uniref:tyrosinase-like n=1 Tax=Branchiostoma lanceolatum TaxID=7740 RepID=UPI003455E562